MRQNRTSIVLRCGVASFVAISALLGVYPAVAQDARVVPVPSDVGRDAKLLQDGDIIVTAQKREERSIDVPVSLTALDATELAAQGNVQLRDYFTRVPGLNLNGRNSGLTTLAIRGVTTGSGTNPTVGVTIDDIPYGSAASAGYGDQISLDLDPSDLSRIEVLKGPQGTLYGASALGGLLKYVTVDPDTREFSGRVQADVSAVAHGGMGHGVRGAINVPLVDDQLALRVSGFLRRDPGFINNVLTGQRDTNDGRAEGGRASLLWRPTTTLSIKLAALLQNTRADDAATLDTAFDLTPVFGRYDHSRIAGTDSFKAKARFYSGIATLDLGSASLTSLTGFADNDYRGFSDVTGTFGRFAANANAGISFANRFRTRRFTQELRLASTGENVVDWLVGGFFTSERSTGLQTFNEVTPRTGALITLLGDYRYPFRYREYAGFGDATFHAGDKFEVQFGVRYAENHQRYDERGAGPLDGDYTIPTRRISGSAFTWLVSPLYRFDRDAMVYARIATGYRPGGPNSNAGGVVPEGYSPDRTTNYELGVKGNFFDRALTLEASAFWIDWTDIQLLQRDATGNTFYANGGKALSRGGEVQATIRPATGLTIAGAVTYTDAVLAQRAPNAIYGLKGDRLPYSARWAATLSADQRVRFGGSIDGTLGATVSYLGDRIGEFNSRATQPRLPLPSFTTLDLRAGIDIDKRWQLQVFAKNATDERGFVSGVPRDSIAKSAPYQVGLIVPRTIGVAATLEY